MSIAHDFSKLSSAEIARLFDATRKLALEERDGREREAQRRPENSTSKGGIHFAGGSWCTCDGGAASHAVEPEKFYHHPAGHMARMENDEDIPVTEAQRQTRLYESMPDSEVARLSQADQNALAEWRDARTEEIAQQFRAARPRYNPTEENHLALLDYLAAEHLARSGQNDIDDSDELTMTLLARGCFTVQTLCNAYDELSRQGRLTPLPGEARRLDGDELRTLSAYCIGCETDADFERVLDSYIRLATGSNKDWRAAAIDTRYSKVLEQAIVFCFENSTPDYSPSAERRRFLKKHLANRFPSVRLLRAGWELCKQAEAKGELDQDEAPAPKLSPEEEQIQQANALAREIAQKSFSGM